MYRSCWFLHTCCWFRTVLSGSAPARTASSRGFFTAYHIYRTCARAYTAALTCLPPAHARSLSPYAFRRTLPYFCLYTNSMLLLPLPHLRIYAAPFAGFSSALLVCSVNAYLACTPSYVLYILFSRSRSLNTVHRFGFTFTLLSCCARTALYRHARTSRTPLQGWVPAACYLTGLPCLHIACTTVACTHCTLFMHCSFTDTPCMHACYTPATFYHLVLPHYTHLHFGFLSTHTCLLFPYTHHFTHTICICYHATMPAGHFACLPLHTHFMPALLPLFTHTFPATVSLQFSPHTQDRNITPHLHTPATAILFLLLYLPPTTTTPLLLDLISGLIGG